MTGHQTSNPNNDPLCTGVSVQVTYNGRTITVPVKDKCPSCDATHIDLSQAAFGQFASTDPATTPGVLNVTWQFVSNNGGGTTPPANRTGPINSAARELVNPQSGKCLDLTGNSSADFTTVQLWACTGAASQKWNVPA